MPDYEDKVFMPPAPVAKVTLRDRTSGKTIADVLMQIDSGADITLIPQSCIDLLSMSVDPNESYELIGFDGHKTLMFAVQLELIFLRRIFIGKYALINQDIGILGRDILNEVALLLDGPNLRWHKQ